MQKYFVELTTHQVVWIVLTEKWGQLLYIRYFTSVRKVFWAVGVNRIFLAQLTLDWWCAHLGWAHLGVKEIWTPDRQADVLATLLPQLRNLISMRCKYIHRKCDKHLEDWQQSKLTFVLALNKGKSAQTELMKSKK